MPVRLPESFTETHRDIVRRFIQGESFSRTDRPLFFEAFDLLHGAKVATEAGWEDFTVVYERSVFWSYSSRKQRGRRSTEKPHLSL